MQALIIILLDNIPLLDRCHYRPSVSWPDCVL